MASDDDTTADPLFKNVPRRPRSAASWPPRKEEPDGGDPSGISVSNNASPPAPTSVASKKRPASSTGGVAAEHVPRVKKHRLVPIEEPKKHRHRLVPEPEDAKDRGVGALGRHGGVLGGMPLALSQNHKAAAAAAASSASSSEAEPAVDWAENERCRKGKTPVVHEDDDACAAVARRPLAGSGLGKLLGDAIRSHPHGSTAAVAGSFKPPSRTTMKPEKPRTKPKMPNKPRSKPKNKPMKKDSGPWFWCGTGKDGVSSAGSDADYSFDRLGVVSDRLRTTLRGLGVADPVRLYGKLLTETDRTNQQARLLMSYKKWRDAEFPLCAFLTEEEKEAARGAGMLLTAYDRGGDAYELKFRFLGCNEAFRLISNWGTFLKHNGLDVAKDEEVPVGDDVMLDLWMFREPGGKAGMVMLHYRRGDAAHADAALDEVEQRRLQQRPNNGSAAAAAAPDAVMEDIVGDVNGDVAAAAPAPSSPSEPSGGGGAIEAAEAAGASGEVTAASTPSEPSADAPSTSSELHGGSGQSDEMTAPLSLGGDDGTEKSQAEAGGALMVMVLEVEVATRSSLGSNAGGAANEVAAPPSSPEQADGGAAMMATEDEDEAAAEATSDEDEAAAGTDARSWNVTQYEFRAAQALMRMSKANSDS